MVRKLECMLIIGTFFLVLPNNLLLLQACRSLPLLQQHHPRPRLAFQSLPLASASPHHVAQQPLTTASSLLSLFGGPSQASSVNPALARQLLSCLHFLVPPRLQAWDCALPRAAFPKKRLSKHAVADLIHRPPRAVAELARRAVEWGGDVSVVLKSLSDEAYLVPDVEGASEQQCQLAKNVYAHRFQNKELNQYMAFLFETVAALAPSAGFNVTLNRFDLFHGHMFLAANTGRMGILFHAREYPAFMEETFPIHLGYCQVGSPVLYDESMNLRNILWLAPMPDCSDANGAMKWLAPGSLLVLDARPDGIIYKELVPDYVNTVRTIYEDDFGAVVADVNYFSLLNDKPEDRIFIC